MVFKGIFELKHDTSFHSGISSPEIPTVVLSKAKMKDSFKPKKQKKEKPFVAYDYDKEYRKEEKEWDEFLTTEEDWQ